MCGHIILRAMLAVAYTTGRAPHDPDKKGYVGPPGWGFGVGLTIPHSKKLIVTKVEQRNKLDRFNDNGRKRTRHTEITLGVRRWRELVINREKWRGIVRQAKAHSGV